VTQNTSAFLNEVVPFDEDPESKTFAPRFLLLSMFVLGIRVGFLMVALWRAH